MENEIEFGEAGEQSTATQFSMPAPTIFPLLLAFGLMLIFCGPLFHSLLSYLGVAVVLLSAAGWWRRVIPFEAHTAVPLDAKHRPSPVLPDAKAAVRLAVGSQSHRVSVPEEAHSYTSGLMGGLAGGVTMAVLACLYGLIAEHSIWFPVNLLAGVVMPSMGDASLEHLRSFDGFAFGAALVGDIGLSALVGVLYAVTLPMFPRYAFFWAGILMPLIWSGLVATLLNLINPALNNRISWPWFVACQLGFGLVCGFVIARGERIKTMQDWTFAERASIDAPGVPRDERRKP